MNEKKTQSLSIPVIGRPWPLPERDYPITPRENLMKALNHEKPIWMPNFYGSSQDYRSAIAQDSPIERMQDAVDWFGVTYKFSAAQGSNTPQGDVLNDITEWEKKIHWEDMSKYDWEADGKRLIRDESRALNMRMSNGPFERLHMLEGFEQALVDLITEPEAVHAFLMRLVDFKIELFNHIRDHVALDYIIASDDWGTARAPFFSTGTFEKTLLEPTVRFAEAVHARGTKFVAHCCGVIDPFVPYMVEEIGVDGLEIQNLNDIPTILKKYGDRITVEHRPDSKISNDPEISLDEARSLIREYVDRFGAHAIPGAGVVVNIMSRDEKRFYAIEEELYEYSKACYARFN